MTFPALAPRPRLAARAAALAAVGLALTQSGVSQADIYRRVDADGVVSFSNTRKQGRRVVREQVRRGKPRPGGSQRPSAGSRPSPGSYDATIREAATLYQIPEELIRAVIKVESGWNPNAVSHANARGLMQLIPATAERMMVSDVFDPRQNIFGGVRYLRVLANLFNGNLELTIAAYNAGENAVIRYGGIPPFSETQQYVVKVLSYYRHYRSRGGG